MDDIGGAAGEPGGAMTLDQAAGLLAERRRDGPAADEGAGRRDDAPPAVEPPAAWDDADRAVFRSLPPEAQQRLVTRERQRDAEIEQRRRELGEQRTQVDRERQAAAAWLAHSLPGMARAVQQKYAGVDWAALAREDAAGYVARRAEYDADLARLDAAHQETMQAAASLAQQSRQKHQAFLERETDAIGRLVPELADPAGGPALKEALKAFAAEAGYTPDQIAWATARDIATLHDAYRWRQAEARREAARKAEAGKRPVPSVQRPGTAVDRSDRAQAAYAEGLKRLDRTGRLEDALTLMKLRRKG